MLPMDPILKRPDGLMELEPHGENDERLSADSRESAIERFAFFQEELGFQ